MFVWVDPILALYVRIEVWVAEERNAEPTPLNIRKEESSRPFAVTKPLIPKRLLVIFCMRAATGISSPLGYCKGVMISSCAPANSEEAESIIGKGVYIGRPLSVLKRRDALTIKRRRAISVFPVVVSVFVILSS